MRNEGMGRRKGFRVAHDDAASDPDHAASGGVVFAVLAN